MKKENKRAAVYIRVAASEQSDKVIAEKREVLRNWCVDNNYAVHYEYCDVGSGYNTKRINLNRLLDDAKKGMFEVVLVNVFSDLTRNEQEYESLVDTLKRWNVDIVICNTDFSSDVSCLKEASDTVLPSGAVAHINLRRKKKLENRVI